MATPSFLSTFLWTQQLRGADAFVARYPGAWLVWEPGPWQAPSRTTLTTLKVDGGSATPKAGDALCFQLACVEGRTLKVGREPDNDVQITDGTVSRHHVVLTCQQGTWFIRVAGGRQASIGQVTLTEQDPPLRLQPGQVLKLGGAQLSFHDTASLLRRLGSTS